MSALSILLLVFIVLCALAVCVTRSLLSSIIIFMSQRPWARASPACSSS